MTKKKRTFPRVSERGKRIPVGKKVECVDCDFFCFSWVRVGVDKYINADKEMPTKK